MSSILTKFKGKKQGQITNVLDSTFGYHFEDSLSTIKDKRIKEDAKSRIEEIHSPCTLRN